MLIYAAILATLGIEPTALDGYGDVSIAPASEGLRDTAIAARRASGRRTTWATTAPSCSTPDGNNVEIVDDRR